LRVKRLKIAGVIVVLVLCAAWIIWRLAELQQLALSGCSAARRADVVLEAEHSHPKVVFNSSGCDYGYVLWWLHPGSSQQ
jgi:hypothetical protein